MHGFVFSPPRLGLSFPTALQRDDAEDPSSPHSVDRRGHFKHKGGAQARSMDDTHLHVHHGGRRGKSDMYRGSSDTNLAAEFLAIPEKEKGGGSKFSLMDKFADVSKAIQEKNANKRSKSPFALFKKGKSRDPSPVPLSRDKQRGDKMRTLPARIQASSSEYSEESESESIPIINEMVGAHGGRKPIKKTMSEASYGSEGFDSETDLTELEAQLEIIDEYYYGVRIFPGQDPTHVYVGWVTPGFHGYTTEFDMRHIRNVVVCTVDQENQVRSRYVVRSTVFLFQGNRN